MKRTLILIAILGGGALVYWLISPLFINKKVSETLEDIMKVEETTQSPTKEGTRETAMPPPTVMPPLEIIGQGEFNGLAGHSAEGMAKLIKIGGTYYVRFEDNFKVTNGPDLFVYFGKDGQYVSSAQLGRLKGNIGGQNYEVPSTVNASNYNEVWVWCRAFAVPFGKVVLK